MSAVAVIEKADLDANVDHAVNAEPSATLEAAAPTPAEVQRIREGDYVVFDINGQRKSVQLIKSNVTVKVGKTFVQADPVIGAAWGSVFELNAANELEMVTEMPSALGPRVDEVSKDNSALFDKNSEAQAMSAADIADLKRQGVEGEAIVAALCASSATYEDKTEFAQAKYRKRKAHKYVTRVTLRRPTGRTVSESLFEKGPARMHNLRPDSLALLLSMANVGAHAKLLVVEACQGLVTAACVERMGGQGVVCACTTDHRPAPLDAVRYLNLPPQQCAVVHSTTLDALLAAKAQAVPTAAESAVGPQQQADAPAQQAPGEPEAAGTAQQATGEPEAAGAAQQAPSEPEAAGAVQQAPSEPEAAGAAQQAPSEPEAAGAAQAATTGHEAERPPVTAVNGAVAEDAAPAGGVADADAGPAPMAVDGPPDALTPASGANDARQHGDGTAASTSQGGQQQGGDARRGEQLPGNRRERRHQQQKQSGVPKLGPSATPEVLRSMVNSGFTSCILAAPQLEASALLDAVFPLLAPSASFAVFSPYLQPLAEAMHALTSSRRGVMLQLHESWVRPYQVLPGRTHPEMMTHGTGGYLLSGIKVVGDGPQPRGAGGGGRGGKRGGKRGRR